MKRFVCWLLGHVWETTTAYLDGEPRTYHWPVCDRCGKPNPKHDPSISEEGRMEKLTGHIVVSDSEGSSAYQEEKGLTWTWEIMVHNRFCVYSQERYTEDRAVEKAEEVAALLGIDLT